MNEYTWTNFDPRSKKIFAGVIIAPTIDAARIDVAHSLGNPRLADASYIKIRLKQKGVTSPQG